ncbi:MAG: hypothetical protein HYR63_06770 [Proteobacteria bacterium]|nr:hypothetical protein [Pseudomonadota bacterium]
MIAHGNPFFYVIDGFRSGFVDHADGNLRARLLMLAAVNVGLSWPTAHLFRIGYELRLKRRRSRNYFVVCFEDATRKFSTSHPRAIWTA